MISAATRLLDAAAGDSLGELIDAANELAVVGLSASDSVKEYVARSGKK